MQESRNGAPVRASRDGAHVDAHVPTKASEDVEVRGATRILDLLTYVCVQGPHTSGDALTPWWDLW